MFWKNVWIKQHSSIGPRDRTKLGVSDPMQKEQQQDYLNFMQQMIAALFIGRFLEAFF